MADKRVEYTIGVRNEGLQNLTRVIAELDKAGVETTEFKRQAEQLRQQLGEMARQQSLIDSFVRIKQETVSAGAAFEAAQAKAQQLGRELAATDAPTKKQTAEFGRAREAVNSTKEAYQAVQLRLQAMRGTLAENNIETTGLAQKQAALRNGVREVEAAVADATARLKDHGASATSAGAGVEKLSTAADKAGREISDLSKAVDEKTRAIKVGLQVEQSEIELQRQHLAASQAEQQARLQAAQAKGDETAATRARNALAQIEADQIGLVARAKRAEANATQQATAARREELSAVGPLNAAHAQELQAAENYAKALRVEAAAADQAAQRTRDLGTAHRSAAGTTDQLSGRVGNLTQLLGQMAGALGAAFTFRELVTAAAQMEQLRSGLTAVTGDATKAGQELEFVRKVALRIGADVTEVGRAFLGLSAATRGTAVEGEPTRQVFEAVATAMGKAGKSSAETANALQALSQMASKGVVQSEELRGQLGEALPGALNAAAKGMGITTAELMKLVEEGKIAASDLFPALAKGLNELYGGAPSAQTLSQEITNIKNSFTEMAANIGDAGGLSALKTGAEIAQGALVVLDATIVATGKSIGTMVAAVANMDFSGLKQAFADIQAEAQDKLLKAAQHNETLRSALKASGDEAAIAALAQQELAAKTAQAGAAAAAGANDFVKLQNGYSLVLKSVREQIAEQERSVIARDAEGNASVALAAAFGIEAEQRLATAEAAANAATEQEKLTKLKLTELATLQEELKSLKAEAAQLAVVDDAKKNQIEALEKLIALRQQDADKAVAQAQASRLASESAAAEAQAYADNSARVQELAAAYEKALGRLEQVRAAKEAGLATTKALKDAELEAGAAARLYRDALADQVKALEAKNQAQQADFALATSALQLQLAQEKSYEATARAMGDEVAVINSKIRQKEIEIKIIEATMKAQIAEAEGSIAVARAKMTEMEASGKLDAVKRIELESAIKLGEAKINQAKAVGESTKALEAEITSLRNGTNARDRHNDSVRGSAHAHDQATAAIDRENAARERGIAAQEKSNELKERELALYREKWNIDKDGFTLDANGQRMQQSVPTGNYVYETAKSQGLDEAKALELMDKYFRNGQGVGTERGTDWFSTVNKAIANMVIEEARKRVAGTSSNPNREITPALNQQQSTGSTQSGGSSLVAGSANAGSGAGGGAGNGTTGNGGGLAADRGGATYVSNVTIPGLAGTTTLRYADAQSQRTGEDLLRKLAQAKGASI